MHRWQGRVALVTGAASGNGRAIASCLLRHGLNVVGCDLDAGRVESIRAEVSGDGVGQLLAIKCDVTKEEEILAMFDRIKTTLGGVDVCVNNAGIPHVQGLAYGETSEWRRLLDVNVLGVAICTREALKSMKEKGVDDGHIINIASIMAYVVVPNFAFYCATKHAVKALTEGLRMELAAENSKIRATTISPGAVNTHLVEQVSQTDKGCAILDMLDVSNKVLESEDIAAAAEQILSAPPHVQINDILLTAVAKRQSSK